MKIYRSKLCECAAYCGREVKPGNRFIVGHNAWGNSNSKGKIRSKEQRENISMAAKMVGSDPEVKKNRSCAQRLAQNRPETKEKKSRSQKITQNRPEERERNSKAQIIAQNKPETKEKRSRTKKKQWQDPEFAAMMCKAQGRLPNKLELLLNKILGQLYPGEWKYVGDGQLFISGKCPDFVNINGQKKIIELFGDYWHRNDDPQNRIDIFKPFGYDTLVIWEKEFKDFKSLRRKIFNFVKEK